MRAANPPAFDVVLLQGEATCHPAREVLTPAMPVAVAACVPGILVSVSRRSAHLSD
ncbi:hypothetical protein ABZ318_12435 [Streptomyces sp. NPDC006197]|uniref:hypothetical protein n=1 Tax=Streptomyces sp. NPDC006197 TaxID=3156685 RepID=UPI0033A6585A